MALFHRIMSCCILLDIIIYCSAETDHDKNSYLYKLNAWPDSRNNEKHQFSKDYSLNNDNSLKYRQSAWHGENSGVSFFFP